MSQRDQGESKPARQSEELSEAGVTLRDTSKGALGQIVFWFGVVISLSHIYANTLGTLPEQWVSALHWGSFAFLCALTYPLSRRLHCRHTKATLAVDILI